MTRVQRKNDFTCFKCSTIIPGPYTALTRHFREVHGIKTSNVERNDELFCGQNGCNLQLFTFANFRYHLSVCEKNSILVENNTFNVELENLDANLENTFMEINSCQNRFEQIPNVQEEIKKQLQLSLGKIMLKLSAEFSVTETAINFLTSSLLCALKQDEQGKISDVI